MPGTIEQKVVEILDQLQVLAPKLGNTSLKYAIWDTQYFAIVNLAYGFISLAAAVILGVMFKRYVAAYEACSDKDESKYVPYMIISAMACAITIGFVLANLGNSENWVGAFRPDIGLAHRIMQKL